MLEPSLSSKSVQFENLFIVNTHIISTYNGITFSHCYKTQSSQLKTIWGILGIIWANHPWWTITFINISLTECYYTFNFKDHWDPGAFTCYTLLRPLVTKLYFINFVEGLIPRVSEAHFGYISLHEYVITIILDWMWKRFFHT